MTLPAKTYVRRVLAGLLGLLLVALFALQFILLTPVAPIVFDLSGPSFFSPVCHVAPSSFSTSCCPSVVSAARELLDGYYTTQENYEWVPFSPALRSVPDDELGDPFDILMLSDTLDQRMLEWICMKLPESQYVSPEKAADPKYGVDSPPTCKSAWGSITW